MNEKVSIIIPIYNSEKFLEDSIGSILNQTYQNIEIIAIDDGSTDDSLKILQNYSDRIIIISQENQGLAGALNTGISQMSGKWFKWFSPDDILKPYAIELLVEKAKELPENTIVYSNWEIIDNKGNKLRDFKESNYNNLSGFEFNIRLLDGQQINVNTTLIPSLLFEKGCLMQNLSNTNIVDYDFFLRAGIIYNTQFYLIEKNLIKYRIHFRQSSHKNIVKTLNQIDKIKTNILNNLDESKRKKYDEFLKIFKKKKRLKQKTMSAGLQIIKHIPEFISDPMLILYLNRIRSGR